MNIQRFLLASFAVLCATQLWFLPSRRDVKTEVRSEVVAVSVAASTHAGLAVLKPPLPSEEFEPQHKPGAGRSSEPLNDSDTDSNRKMRRLKRRFKKLARKAAQKLRLRKLAVNRATNTAEHPNALPAMTYERFEIASCRLDPLVPSTGEMTYDYPVISSPGIGMGIDITFTYRSGYSYDGPLSDGWDHNWNRRFEYDSTLDEFTYYHGNRLDVYPHDTGVLYSPPAGSFELEIKSGTDGGKDALFRRMQDGTLEVYQELDAGTDWYFLVRVEHRDTDNTITLTYDSGNDNRLDTITDTRGTDYLFEYNSNDYIESVIEDPDTGDRRDWLLTYSSGTPHTLDAIRGPLVSSARRRTSFTYTVPSGTRELLASVKAPREDASGTAYLQMDYNTSGQVIRQVFGAPGTGVQDYEVAYTANTTTETDREGTDYVFHFAGSGVSRKLTQLDVTDGSVSFKTFYTWNSDDLLETATHPIRIPAFSGVSGTDSGGYLYQYSDGRVTAAVRLADNVSASGYSGSTDIATMRLSADCLVTEYAYQSTANWVLLNVVTDPLENDWALGRDTLGNVTRLTTPLHTSDPWVIAYDSSSRPTSVTDPESRVTSLEYFGAGSGETGLLKKVRVDPTGLNLTTEYGRDRFGNVTSVRDAEANTWTYTRNALNLVTQMETPLGFETDYSYDLNNCLTKVEADHGNTSMNGTSAKFTTEYEYNILDRVTKVKQKGAGTVARTWTYTYDLEERVTNVESPEARDVESEYDFRGLLVTRTVAPGTADETETTFTYTSSGLLETTTNGNGWVTTQAYDGFNRYLDTVDGEEHKSEVIYDKNSNRNWSCNWTAEDAIKFPLEFNVDETLKSPYVRTGSGVSKLVAKTYTGYDANNQANIMIRYAYEWDSTSAALLPTAPGNQLTSNMYYDKAGVMTRMTEPCGCGGGTGVLHSLDAAGRITISGDEEGNITTYTLDALGRPTLVKREETQGATNKSYWTSYVYDDDGRVVTVTQQAAATANATNDLITVVDYDGQGRRVKVTDPNGNFVEYEHDKYGRMKKTFISLGTSSKIEQVYAYDQDSLVTAVTAVRGGTPGDGITSYDYDNAGRVTEELDESRSVTEGKELYTYDSAGLLKTVTQRNGTVCTLTYDDRGLVTQKAYTSLPTGVVGPATETYEYDSLGRMWYAGNSDALVLREWNSIGKLNREYQYVKKFDATSVSSVGAGGHRRDLSYSFNDSGLVASVNYPDNSHVVSYEYDDINQMTAITKTVGATATPITEWDMQGPGRALKLTHGNGVEEEMSYDEFGRLTTLEWDRPVGASRVSLFKYTRGYDKGSRPVFEQREFWGSGATPTKLTGAQDFGDVYEYDRANRLTAVHRGVGYHTGTHSLPSTFDPAGTSLDFSRKATYVLDETGNRQTLNIDSSDSSTVSDFRDEIGTHLDDNQLTSVAITDHVASTTTTDSYTWDKNGTLTTDPDLTGDFEVDVHNRIRTYGDYTYRYDALGRRVAKDDGTNTELDSVSRRFYYDGVRCVQEFETHVVDDSGEGVLVCSMDTPVWTRIYGPFLVDQILWGLQKTLEYDDVTGCEAIVSEQEMFFALDFLGSVIAITDANASVGVIEQYRCEEYGTNTVLAGDGVTVRSLSNYDQNHYYTGRRLDTELGLYYFRKRHYGSSSGVFLSRDPIKASDFANLYSYVDNQPIEYVDPFGLAKGKGLSTHFRVAYIFEPFFKGKFIDKYKCTGQLIVVAEPCKDEIACVCYTIYQVVEDKNCPNAGTYEKGKGRSCATVIMDGPGNPVGVEMPGEELEGTPRPRRPDQPVRWPKGRKRPYPREREGGSGGGEGKDNRPRVDVYIQPEEGADNFLGEGVLQRKRPRVSIGLDFGINNTKLDLDGLHNDGSATITIDGVTHTTHGSSIMF